MNPELQPELVEKLDKLWNDCQDTDRDEAYEIHPVDQYVSYILMCNPAAITLHIDRLLSLESPRFVKLLRGYFLNGHPTSVEESEHCADRIQNYLTKMKESDDFDEGAPIVKELVSTRKILGREMVGRPYSDLLRESTSLLLPSMMNKTFVTEGVASEHYGTMQPTGISDGDDSSPEAKLKTLKVQFGQMFVDTFMVDENSKTNVRQDCQKVMEMLAIAEEYDEVVEEASKGWGVARRTARKGEKTSRRMTNSLRRTGHEAKRVKVIAKKIPGNFDNLINSTFGAIKRMDHAERRNRILEGGFRFKIYKIIRNGALVGAAWAVSPALAAIGILVHVLKDKTLDERARNQLIRELESELNIVKEKVRDADQKGDSAKKYQLMRIQNRLEEDLDRIKFRLKGPRSAPYKGVK